MMKNSSIADFVAAGMNEVLKSKSHQDMFGKTWLKTAQDMSEPKADEACADDSGKDENKADDASDEQEASDAKDKEEKDCSMADDEELGVSAAFNIAIESLLTASAALDDVGMEKNAALSLRIASIVVEAKEKVKAAKKKGKLSMKELQALKDKKNGKGKDSGKGSGKSGTSSSKGSGKSGSGASAKKK